MSSKSIGCKSNALTRSQVSENNIKKDPNDNSSEIYHELNKFTIRSASAEAEEIDRKKRTEEPDKSEGDLNTSIKEIQDKSENRKEVSKKKSNIWKFFVMVSKDPCMYECILCCGKLRYHGGASTANLHRHMRNKHPSVSRSSSLQRPLRNTIDIGTGKKDPSHQIPSGVEIDVTNTTSIRSETEVKEQERPEGQKQRKTENKSRKGCGFVWNYFKLASSKPTGKKYRCILCSGQLKYCGGSTANLYRHMRRIHPSEPLSPSAVKIESTVLIDCNEDNHNDDCNEDNDIDDCNVGNDNDDFNEENDNDVAERLETPNECHEHPKETIIGVLTDDISYDASQPWRFFDILKGNAKCRLCFQYVCYNTISDLAALLNHLQSNHSISFPKSDSSDWIEAVDTEKASAIINENRSGADKTKRHFETYFTDFKDYSATCKMCLSSVSFTRNKKSLISHLYKEHTSYFSKRYPTFWQFSKYFNRKFAKCPLSNDNLTPNCNLDSTDNDQEMDTGVPPESTAKHITYPDNILSHFLNLDGNNAKCSFCSKSISFLGDVNILEEHIRKQHKTVFIHKIVDDLVFADKISSRKGTNECVMNKFGNGPQSSSKKDVLSYFKMSKSVENRQFKCKICSMAFSVQNNEKLNQLSEHVWDAHMSKVFRSIVSLQSFGCLDLNIENISDDEKLAESSSIKLSNINLDLIKWVKPVGKLSNTWKYFLTPDPPLPYTKCRLCGVVLSIKAMNMSNLARHLNTKHNDRLRSNLNMFHENGRMFRENSKRKCAKTYSMNELRKSVQCRICLAHFSEWKSFCKHIRCKHNNCDYSKEISLAKTMSLENEGSSKISPNRKIQIFKCKLCDEYLLRTRRETFENHMLEKHFTVFCMGVTYVKYKQSEKKMLTLNDEMDMVIESFPNKDEIVLKTNSYLSSFFFKSGSGYAKCKICRKFISKSRHCRHRVPLIFSVSFGLQSMKMSKNALTAGLLGNGKVSSRIYCCSLNMIKNYCDTCLKNPMCSICRCIVNKRFILTPFSNVLENSDVLSTEYLQDNPKSERKAYSVTFSINYFEKSCCLLCSEKIFSQGSNLQACFDHFRLKHGSLLKNLNKMSKSVERRKLIDSIDYETFVSTPFGLVNASENPPIELNREQNSMIMKVVGHNQTLTSDMNVYDETPTSNFVVDETLTSLGVNNDNATSIVVIENPTPNFVVTENPKSNFVVTENPRSNFIVTENPTSSFVVTENPSSNFVVTENPTSNFLVTENPSSNFVVTENSTSNFVVTENPMSNFVITENPSSAFGVDSETNASVLAITDGNLCLDAASEVPVVKKPSNTSCVWKYFTKVDQQSAFCNACRCSWKFSSLHNLRRHLKSKHPKLFNLLQQETARKTASLRSERFNDKWKHFEKYNDDWAQCKNCKGYFSMRGGSSSNLMRHLQSKNCINKQSDRETLCNLTKNAVTTRKGMSSVWHYFERSSHNKEAACKMCKRFISIRNNNVSNLKRHLRNVHTVYIVPASNLNPQVLGLQNASDNAQSSGYVGEYIVPEVIGKDYRTRAALHTPSENSDGNYAFQETFPPPYVTEEVVGTGQRNASIDDNAPETIDLDVLLKKVYRSRTWNFFTKLANGRVKCKLCDDSLAFKSNKVIHNLTRHLKSKHPSALESIEPPDSDNTKCVIYVNDEPRTEPPDRIIQDRRARTSYLWKYFFRYDSKLATCKFCTKRLTYKPLSNLRRHLETLHSHVLSDTKIGSLSVEKTH